MVIQIILISISLSIDALGIGMAYRAKLVSIPFSAKAVIAMISTIVMAASLQMGVYLNGFLPPDVIKIVGAAMLSLIGIIMIRKSLFGKETAYDFDKSHRIELGEAALLGFALSSDSIAAGVAIASLDLAAWLMPITAGGMQFLFLWIGEWIINSAGKWIHVNQKACGVFGGIILLLIAYLRFR